MVFRSRSRELKSEWGGPLLRQSGMIEWFDDIHGDSHFYRTQLRPTIKRIDAYVIRWARRKYKRMVHQTKGGRDWFDRLRRKMPGLFAHWPLCHGNGRTSGAV